MSTLTVYFDDPWWVGVIEIEDEGVLRVFRHVFGSEPSNEEILAFVLQHFVALVRQSTPGVPVASPHPHRVNPKRAARTAARLGRMRGMTTRSQAALQLAREAEQQARQVRRRVVRAERAADKRQKARAKAQARRRGA